MKPKRGINRHATLTKSYLSVTKLQVANYNSTGTGKGTQRRTVTTWTT